MDMDDFDKLPREIQDALRRSPLEIEKITKLEWARDPLGLPFVGKLEADG